MVRGPSANPIDLDSLKWQKVLIRDAYNVESYIFIIITQHYAMQMKGAEAISKELECSPYGKLPTADMEAMRTI